MMIDQSKAEPFAKFFFNEILPEVRKISKQPEKGFHGLSHTRQVALFAVDVALSIGQDPIPVLFAAGLHDAARDNDAYDLQHGPASVPLAMKIFETPLGKHLSPELRERVCVAIRDHTIGMNAADPISACLWDADRIRLSWRRGYDPKFFSTPRGRELAAMNSAQQKAYMDAWKNFSQIIH